MRVRESAYTWETRREPTFEKVWGDIPFPEENFPKQVDLPARAPLLRKSQSLVCRLLPRCQKVMSHVQ